MLELLLVSARKLTHHELSMFVSTHSLAYLTGAVSLFRDGAVGASVIWASTHVRLDGGGAVKLLPYELTWPLIQVGAGGNLSPLGEQGFARYCTKPEKFFGTTHNNLCSVLCWSSMHCCASSCKFNWFQKPPFPPKINCFWFLPVGKLQIFLLMQKRWDTRWVCWWEWSFDPRPTKRHAVVLSSSSPTQ
jgi:hypothetical protein